MVKAKNPERERRELKKQLHGLTAAVDCFLALIDAEMKKQSRVERGERIASICNSLELINDEIRHFTLGQKFPLKKVGTAPP